MDAASLPVRKSTRLVGFDYSSAGAYFISICLQEMSQMRFGSVVAGDLLLSEAGVTIADCWESTLERFAGTAFDSAVVMPNHLHAIVYLGTDPKIATTS